MDGERRNTAACVEGRGGGSNYEHTLSLSNTQSQKIQNDAALLAIMPSLKYEAVGLSVFMNSCFFLVGFGWMRTT